MNNGIGLLLLICLIEVVGIALGYVLAHLTMARLDKSLHENTLAKQESTLAVNVLSETSG
jgi:hypothetical protein